MFVDFHSAKCQTDMLLLPFCLWFCGNQIHIIVQPQGNGPRVGGCTVIQSHSQMQFGQKHGKEGKLFSMEFYQLLAFANYD